MICPECQAPADVLLGCDNCPLICCYECAAEFPTCERQSDRWVQPKSKSGATAKGLTLTSVAPTGHHWREASRT